MKIRYVSVLIYTIQECKQSQHGVMTYLLLDYQFVVSTNNKMLSLRSIKFHMYCFCCRPLSIARHEILSVRFYTKVTEVHCHNALKQKFQLLKINISILKVEMVSTNLSFVFLVRKYISAIQSTYFGNQVKQKEMRVYVDDRSNT